jgi:hypothetical protein
LSLYLTNDLLDEKIKQSLESTDPSPTLAIRRLYLSILPIKRRKPAGAVKKHLQLPRNLKIETTAHSN